MVRYITRTVINPVILSKLWIAPNLHTNAFEDTIKVESLELELKYVTSAVKYHPSEETYSLGQKPISIPD